MKEIPVYAVGRPLKVRKCTRPVTSFSDEDYEGIILPHTDSFMVTMMITNHKIHCILVHTGSSVDVLYKSTFDLMKIDRERLVPFQHPLVGFTGKQVMLLGSIKLQVTAGDPPRQKTITVKFLIVEETSAYNAIT
jgi:hypothetical protein